MPLGMEATALSRRTINAFERAQSALPHSVIRQDAPPIERWQWGGLQFTGTGEGP